MGMCGMQIKWIDDSKGVDMAEFKKLCEQHKDDLAALMVTYPSTRAFFEDGIIEMTDCVHANGGQVYMDGANMNAQLGLTSPGIIGADVCHLNLHKTFSIPHLHTRAFDSFLAGTQREAAIVRWFLWSCLCCTLRPSRYCGHPMDVLRNAWGKRSHRFSQVCDFECQLHEREIGPSFQHCHDKFQW